MAGFALVLWIGGIFLAVGLFHAFTTVLDRSRKGCITTGTSPLFLLCSHGLPWAFATPTPTEARPALSGGATAMAVNMDGSSHRLWRNLE